MELISVYGSSPNIGKRTIAMTLAQESARNEYRTLLIELDYVRPSIALTHGITHPQKNVYKYFERAFNERFFDIEGFIMKKDDVKSTQKDLNKIHQNYPNELDFMIFPIEFDNSMFPRLDHGSETTHTEKAQSIIQQFINNIYASNYDVVIFSLPNHTHDIFAVPIMLESTKVVNVIGPSLVRFEESKKVFHLFEKFNQEKWINVLNMAAPKLIDETDYKMTMSPLTLHHIIPFDEVRLRKELNAEIGSPTLDEIGNEILESLGLELRQKENKGRFNFLRKG